MCHDIENRTAEIRRRFLGDDGRAYSLLTNYFSTVGRKITGEDLQQGGFAGPVSTQQAETVSFLNLQIDSLKKRRASES
jgi:hypothetical protein